MRTLLFSVLLVVLGQAHAEFDYDSLSSRDEAYTGELLERDGLAYKPFQTEPFSGLHTLSYEDGPLRLERTYKNGKKDGLFRLWYENGQLIGEGTYKNGKTEGLHRLWYENGQLLSEYTYKNGKLEGVSRMWGENGQRVYDACWSNGEEVDMSNCE